MNESGDANFAPQAHAGHLCTGGTRAGSFDVHPGPEPDPPDCRFLSCQRSGTTEWICCLLWSHNLVSILSRQTNKQKCGGEAGMWAYVPGNF